MKVLLKINITNTSVNAEQITQLRNILSADVHFMAASMMSFSSLSKEQSNYLVKANEWLKAVDKNATSVFLLPINLHETQEKSNASVQKQIANSFVATQKQWKDFLCIPVITNGSCLSANFTALDEDNAGLVEFHINELKQQAALTLELFLVNGSKNIIDFKTTLSNLINTVIYPKSIFLSRELTNIVNNIFSNKTNDNPFTQLKEKTSALLKETDPLLNQLENARIEFFNGLSFLEECWDRTEGKEQKKQMSSTEYKALIRSTQILCPAPKNNVSSTNQNDFPDLMEFPELN